ncbi:hypothetical protein HN873_070696 [Arachis hypogaea]
MRKEDKVYNRLYLIDFVLTVGRVSLAEAPAFKKAPGGAPANIAVDISRLGSSSAFIGKVYLSLLCLFIHMVIWFLVTQDIYHALCCFNLSDFSVMKESA